MTNQYAPASNLFLPLTEGLAAQLAEGRVTGDFFAHASVAQLAVVLLLQNLPALVAKKTSLARIEAMYEGVVEIGLATVPEGHPSFADQVQERFSAKSFSQGLALIQSIGISLLDEDEVEQKDYLLASGHWDPHFTLRHKARVNPPLLEIPMPGGRAIYLGDQQARLFGDLRQGLDESIHLQGYAGIGKTFLITKFFELLNPSTTLLMAHLPSQLVELKKRVHVPSNSDQLNAFTFGHMANIILNSDESPQAWRISDRQRAMTDYLVTDQQTVNWLKIQPVGPLPPRVVANLCRRTVFSYCMSASSDIEAKHLPAIDSCLTSADLDVLLEYSRRLWQETVTPSAPSIRFPVRNAHRIKYLSLSNHLDFPDCYTHIIVDESHDLSPVTVQILDRSSRAVISLGDDYQHIAGMAAKRNGVVRQRNITQSIRAGKQMGGVLNPLIQLHPGIIKDEFEGRADYPTVISHYDGYTPIPDKPTTIIVANEWGLLNWFSNLVDAGSAFEMPLSARQELKSFIAGLCSLYHEGRRANHRMLFQYESWNALANAMGANHAFRCGLRLLDEGMTSQLFDEIMIRHCPEAGAAIKLARIDDVKNQEFNTVLISRDLMRPPKAGSAHSKARICSMLYTAASRAKHELIVPGNLADWLRDIGRR